MRETVFIKKTDMHCTWCMQTNQNHIKIRSKSRGCELVSNRFVQSVSIDSPSFHNITKISLKQKSSNPLIWHTLWYGLALKCVILTQRQWICVFLIMLHVPTRLHLPQGFLYKAHSIGGTLLLGETCLCAACIDLHIDVLIKVVYLQTHCLNTFAVCALLCSQSWC